MTKMLPYRSPTFSISIGRPDRTPFSSVRRYSLSLSLITSASCIAHFCLTQLFAWPEREAFFFRSISEHADGKRRQPTLRHFLGRYRTTWLVELRARALSSYRRSPWQCFDISVQRKMNARPSGSIIRGQRRALEMMMPFSWCIKTEGFFQDKYRQALGTVSVRAFPRCVAHA